jgi:hypothetical protein
MKFKELCGLGTDAAVQLMHRLPVLFLSFKMELELPEPDRLIGRRLEPGEPVP